MTTQLLLRMDSALKDRVVRLARQEGKSVSEMLREMFENFVQEHDISGYVDNVWGRIGGKLKSRKITPEQISTTIRQYRKSR